MGFLWDNSEFAEAHGYASYTCQWHGRFFSDSGDGCPICGPEDREDDEDTEES